MTVTSRAPMVIVFLGLCACASTGTQVKEADLSQFQKGVTREADVEKQLGPPQSTIVDSDGTRSIAYIYAHSQLKGSTLVPVVGLFTGGATGNTSIVTFRFGADGKLIDYSSSNSNADVRTGIVSGSATK